MKILITGTAGFIGFHLARSLLEQGHDVVGYDNFNAYYSVALKEARNAHLASFPSYSSYLADLCQWETIQEVFSHHRFERVCHLAAQAGVRYSLTHPFAYQKSNLEGFLNILEACRRYSVPRLVYASSSSVYGGNTKLPFSEDDPVDTPVSVYAATKRANELMAHSYGHLYGFQTIALRFFSVYGPWGRPDMAMWHFSESMISDKPIRVYNFGKMERDFTYIDDIVRGISGALFRDGLDKNEIINLGNNSPVNLLDMIHMLAAEFGVKPRLDLQPMQPGDVVAAWADIRRAQRKLGFDPTTSIEVGIRKFAGWFRAYRTGSNETASSGTDPIAPPGSSSGRRQT